MKRSSPLPASLFRTRREFFREELCHAPIVIFPSERVKDIYRDYGISPRHPIVMMPLNTMFTHITPKVVLRAPRAQVVFGYVGSVLATKGVHLILDAVDRLRDLDGRFVVHIYGGGDEVYRAQLQKRASAMDAVVLKGPYRPSEIQSVLENIDVAIVPSLWEDCAPIVLNELRLSRTPLIGSKIGGIPETVQHGVTGFLFEPGNVAELAMYMRTMVEHPSTISSFMASTELSFDMEAYMQKVLELYGGAIKHGVNL